MIVEPKRKDSNVVWSRSTQMALAVAVIGAGCILNPTVAWSTSLADALRLAYRYNPEIAAERARLRATDEGVASAMSGYRPTVNGQYSIDNTTVSATGADGNTTTRSFTVTLSQPIFRGFQTRNAVNEAEANVRAGQETLRSTEQDVLLSAATAYVDVVRDAALVRLRQNNVEFLTRELKATQDRFQVGEVTRTDVAQARARRAAAVSALDLARANLKSSRATFVRVVGSQPTRLRAPGSPRRLLPKTQKEAVDLAITQNPSVVGALYSEQAARFSVNQLTGQLLPQVNLDASYNVSRDPDKTETGTVTGTVSIPLYQAGSVRSDIRAAKHLHVSRIQEVETARTTARASAISAWSLLQASRAQLISDRAQVDANRIALEGVREEERVGQRTLLDVLDAQQELLDAQVSLTTTQRDIIVNAYTLLSAVGRLDMLNLGLTRTVYDPDVHYHKVRRKWFGISITHRDGRTEHLDVAPARARKRNSVAKPAKGSHK